MGDELRLYDFAARFAAYGFDRDEAMRVVRRLVGDAAAADPMVASAQIILTNDRHLLARLGIDREGQPVRLPPEGQIPDLKPPPPALQRRERARRKSASQRKSDPPRD